MVLGELWNIEVPMDESVADNDEAWLELKDHEDP